MSGNVKTSVHVNTFKVKNVDKNTEFKSLRINDDQDSAYNGCHDLRMLYLNVSDIVRTTLKDGNYCFSICNISLKMRTISLTPPLPSKYPKK